VNPGGPGSRAGPLVATNRSGAARALMHPSPSLTAMGAEDDGACPSSRTPAACLSELPRARGRRLPTAAAPLEALTVTALRVGAVPDPARMAAIASFSLLAVDRESIHAGGSPLARHVANAILVEDSAALAEQGTQQLARRIDAAVMAVYRAAELAGGARGRHLHLRKFQPRGLHPRGRTRTGRDVESSRSPGRWAVPGAQGRTHPPTDLPKERR
jgi:hypothetical protein